TVCYVLPVRVRECLHRARLLRLDHHARAAGSPPDLRWAGEHDQRREPPGALPGRLHPGANVLFGVVRRNWRDRGAGSCLVAVHLRAAPPDDSAARCGAGTADGVKASQSPRSGNPPTGDSGGVDDRMKLRPTLKHRAEKRFYCHYFYHPETIINRLALLPE